MRVGPLSRGAVTAAGVLAWLALCGGPSAAEPMERIAAEDYAVYDRVIDSKFLTSATQLVLIGRVTVRNADPLDPEAKFSMGWLEARRFFDGALPADLAAEFVLRNQKPAPLEPRFNFGVSYRLVSPDGAESPEARGPSADRRIHIQRMAGGIERQAAGLPVQRLVPRTTIGILAFSRVAYGSSGAGALVYVGDHRIDGTGAGLLVWLRRTANGWEPWETEVVWTLSDEEPGR